MTRKLRVEQRVMIYVVPPPNGTGPFSSTTPQLLPPQAPLAATCESVGFSTDQQPLVRVQHQDRYLLEALLADRLEAR
jgi:hypothetical protein